MKRAWFGPKRIGIGISPRSWQGWLCTFAFAAILMGLSRLLRPGTFWPAWAMAADVLVYGLVIYLTYEGEARP